MSGIEWTVATLAPWAVAPHPNFPSRSARAEQLLALVADYRVAELERYLPLLTDDTPDAQRGLVTDAGAAIRMDSQASATHLLARWCTSEGLPVGARVAAALFTSASFAEMDDLAASILAVESTLEALPDVSPDSGMDSIRLMRSSLLLSRALRSLEFGDRSTAQISCEEAIETSIIDDLPIFDEFPTSEAIGWSSIEVQIDVMQCINLRARELWSALAPIRDNSWVELVRSRPNWLDVRAERRALPGLDKFLSETFSDRFDAHNQSVEFVNEDGIIAPIEASLFNAEVSSDFVELARRRKNLGMLRLLRAKSSLDAENVITDGIRLLRRSRDKKALEPALRDIRAKGPLQPLKASCLEVLRIAERRKLNRFDILVLTAGAEVSSESELNDGVTAIFQFLDGGDEEPGATQGLASWTRIEAGWRAITALVPYSNRDGQIADSGLGLFASGESPYLLSSLIARLVNAISWQRVPMETANRWRDWAGQQDSVEFADLAWHILDTVPRTDGATERLTIARPSGLTLAERIVVESQQGEDVSPAELAAATSAVENELIKIRTEASRGSFALGGRSAPLLAAHLAIRFGGNELWRALVDLLKSPVVAAIDKSNALSFLGSNIGAVPEDVRAEVATEWQAVVSAPEDPFSGRGSVEFISASLSLGVRIGAVSLAEFMARVTELSCGSPTEQVEALRCIAYSDSSPVVNQWIATLAVQLSLSEDPSVRANAAFVLGRRLELHAEMRPVTNRQLIQLMTSDAVQVPVLALRGISDATPAVSADSRELLIAVISQLATGHLAVSVRRAAAELLDSWGR